ncbi:Ff.00g041230.m01.CDS01 [Fusarium sp. VM40]|nr:Ff.00g041230.m01.CDS01 [Fusarium sp. VM40]
MKDRVRQRLVVSAATRRSSVRAQDLVYTASSVVLTASSRGRTNADSIRSRNHIRDLEEKVARYENTNIDGTAYHNLLSPRLPPTDFALDKDQVQGGSEPPASANSPSSSEASGPSPISVIQVEGNDVHPSPIPPHPQTLAPEATTSSPKTNLTPRSLAPATSLSSSETFSSEIRTLLAERSRPNPPFASSQAHNATPGLSRHSQLGSDKIKHWPTEEDAYSMLSIVVLNVGISQHLFDARAFSDNLSLLFDHDTADDKVPELWYAECLLVFAIGRLLQAKWDNRSQLPGDEFFQEAIKRLPDMSDLRKQGVLAIELMGLCALYLQISDRKEDAYLYASTALRLSLSLSLHKSASHQKSKRSEAVHRNRLWWSIYMQERRLAAAVGFPVSILDRAITTAHPSDQIGYPSAAAIEVNVKLAQITGRITTTIYSQNNESEGTFIKEVQDILHSLHKIENEMPAEISGGSHPTELLLNDASLSSSQLSAARTIASLHLTVNQNVMYAVRPILLYMAHSSSGGSDICTSMSPKLRRLAGTCVEAARKSLVILHGLRKRDIIARHAFLDLDCLFSTGFTFALAVIINSDKVHAGEGIETVRGILMHLSNLGNQAATKRLTEIDQMCASLGLETETPNTHIGEPQALMQPFSLSSASQSALRQPQGQTAITQNAINGNEFGGEDTAMAGVDDLSDIMLEGEDDLYWIYHNTSLSLTGVEQLDWENLDFQTV